MSRIPFIEPMLVAQVNYEGWGNENDPISDWSLAMKHALFSHREACEFIFWLGDQFNHYSMMQLYRSYGFSNRLINTMDTAYEAGYKYLCIYA